MSGKQKQAQRTKGNTKASSSARAAELVEQQGAGGFIGFGSMGGDLGYVPVSAAADDPDISVDADFRMLLKKVTKKDTATKLKALSEISALCDEKDLDSIKSILPFWPRIYNRLTIDSERRVREAVQRTFERVIVRVGRALAPHLRSLQGPWLVAQCDPYAPAASAACAAWNALFPVAAKRTAALLFAKTDILAHIEDNLFVQRPQTLSDPKTTDAEDMQTKYERVVAESLGAWRLLLTQAPPQQDLVEQYRVMIGKPAFWKLQKHQSELIRAAFYQLCSALCEAHAPVVLEFKDKLCPAVLYSLDDSAPLVCPPLWDAVLHVTSTVKDWWDIINARKGMLPKLWTLLRGGGSGSATVVCPSLLPLLSTIPAEHGATCKPFMEALLQALTAGLSNEKVQSSRRDVNAIVRAFMETARYSIRHTVNLTDVKAVGDVLLVSCVDQIIHVFKACLLESSDSLHQSPFYSLLTDFMRHTRSKEELTCVGIATWTDYSGVVRDIVTTCREEYVIQRLKAVLDCFVTVKPEPETKEASKPKVKFATEDDVSKEENKSNDVFVDLEKDSREYKFLQECIHLLANTLCENKFDLRGHGEVLCHLLDIGGHNPELLNFAGYISHPCTPDAISLIRSVLVPYIRHGCAAFVIKSTLRLLALQEANIVEEEMEGLLQDSDLCPDDKLRVLCYACDLCAGGQSTSSMDRGAPLRTWLLSESFQVRLVDAVKKLQHCCLQSGKSDNRHSCPNSQPVSQEEKNDIRSSSTHLLQLVTTALQTYYNGESVLTIRCREALVSELLGVLRTLHAIKDCSQDVTTAYLSFISEIACALFPTFQATVGEDLCVSLLSELFSLYCSSRDVESDRLRTAWSVALSTLLEHDRSRAVSVLPTLTATIQQSLNTADTWQRQRSIAKIGKEFIECISDREPERTLALQKLHVNTSHKDIPLQLDVLCARCHCTGLPNIALDSQWLEESQLVHNLGPVYLNLDLDTYSVTCEQSVDKVMDLCHSLAYIDALLSCTYSKPVENVESHRDNLSRMLTEALKALDEETRTGAFSTLYSRARNQGAVCAAALKIFFDASGTGVDLVNLLAQDTNRFSTLSEGDSHMLCQCMSLLPGASMLTLISAMADYILKHAEGSVQEVLDCGRYLCVLVTALGTQGVDLTGDSEPFLVTAALLPFTRKWHTLEDNFLLFESTVTAADWGHVQLAVQLMRLLGVMVERAPALLNAELWDFTLCSMLSWIQTCKESCTSLCAKEATTATTVLATRVLACQAFRLARRAVACVDAITDDSAERFPPSLRQEWNEFFSQATFSAMLPMFVQIAETCHHSPLNESEATLLDAVSLATSYCPLEHLLTHELTPRLDAEDTTSGLSDSLQTLLNILCPLLLENHRGVQHCAFTLLSRVTAEVWKAELAGSGEEESRAPPRALWHNLQLAQVATVLVIDGAQIGDHCTWRGYSAEEGACVAYLLAWSLLIDLFNAAIPAVRAAYASHLREAGAVTQLLDSLFVLMPEIPVVEMRDKLSAHSPNSKLSSSLNLFAEKPDLTKLAGNVGHLACHVYYLVLRHLPALARQWWGEQDRRAAEIVDRFTAKYASPILLDEQLSEVSGTVFEQSNMSVKIRPLAREVEAIYQVDESSLELLVTLSEDHPLRPLKVESGQKTGIAKTQWRNWLLQLTTFLLHQNGSLTDALVLWKKNVDKRFDGVEECLICFSIIHGSTCHLPKLQCKTCKKKFHSACLYKWFNTSNNSSCPNCRNLF